MKLFDRIKAATSAFRGSEEKAARIYSGVGRGFPAYSGQDLSSNSSAYRYVLWTYICIKAISEDLAGVPLRFYTGQGKAKKEVTQGLIYDLFANINPNLSTYEFWLRMIASYALLGSAWAGLEKNNGGSPIEIYPLMTNRVEVIADADEFISGIKYRLSGGTEIKYEKSELLWFRSFNPENEYWGLSTVEPAKDTLISELNARAYQKAFFANNATPPGFLVAKNKIDRGGKGRTVDAIEERHQGTINQHKIDFLEGEWTWVKTGESLRDMSYERLRKMNREDILGGWGVPPGRVGINEFSNYANLEAQLRLYWTSTILPISRAISSSMNSNFLKRFEKGIWCAHDFSQIEAMQENQQNKSSIAVSLHDSGILTANEIRDKYYDLPPHPDGDILKNSQPGFDLGSLSDPGSKGIHSKEAKAKLDKWYVKDLRRRKHELLMTRSLIPFFGDQISKLKARAKKFPEDYTLSPEDTDILFDNLSFEKDLKELLIPHLETAVKAAGQASLDEFPNAKRKLKSKIESKRFITRREILAAIHGEERKDDPSDSELEAEIAGVFDLSDPRVAIWLEGFAANSVTHISATTKKEIRRILKQGYDAGWSVAQLADELESQLGGMTESRSYTIAQTEMGAAMNKGTYEGYLQTGLELEKDWLDTPDEKTRDSHRAAGAASPIPLWDKFKVGTDYLDHPGDPSGSAEEIINCRCGMSAREKTGA